MRLESERKATAVTDAAVGRGWHGRRAASPRAPARPPGHGPFFLWVHYYDPHAPYDPPPQFAAAAKGQAYDGEVAYVDAELRRLLDALSSRGLLSNTVIVVAGDHGESLGEHGERTHGMLLYEAGRAGAVDRQGARHQAGRAHGPRQPGRHRPTILGLVGQASWRRARRAEASRLPDMDGVDLLAGAAARRPRALRRDQLPARRRLGAAAVARLAARGSCSARPRSSCTTSSATPAKRRTSPASARRSRRRWRPGSATWTPRASPRRPRRARRRRNGCARSATWPRRRRRPSRPTRRTPRARSPRGVSSKTRSPTCPPAGATGRCRGWRALAARYPNAQVFRKTLRAGAARFRPHVRGAEGVSARLPRRGRTTRRCFTTSPWPRARRARRPRRCAPNRPRSSLDPKYPAAHDGLGLLHADAGRAADAVAAFAKADGTRAEQPVLLDEPRQRRARTRRHVDARRPRTSARSSIDATWPDAANGLGVMLVQGGRPADAMPWFEKALARSPDFVEAQLNLGIALQQAGQIERAKAQYRKVLGAPRQYRQQREAAATLLGSLTMSRPLRAYVEPAASRGAASCGAACGLRLATVCSACSRPRASRPAPPDPGAADSAARLRPATCCSSPSTRCAPTTSAPTATPPRRRPSMDRLAREGARFDRAFATAPITLTSHASLLTGLYPPGHGARHNGVAMRARRADARRVAPATRGSRPARSSAAFPLDRRFGLARGFDVYGDRMPRGDDGRLANERPATRRGRRHRLAQGAVALASGASRRRGRRTLLPLGTPLRAPRALRRPRARRRAHRRRTLRRRDRRRPTAQSAGCWPRSAPQADQTLIVVASDHGEAFGEHGEVGHSIFVYDTTLRVALIAPRPGRRRQPCRRRPGEPDRRRPHGHSPARHEADGRGRRRPRARRSRASRLPARALYAESFAPLLDFGWSPLRTHPRRTLEGDCGAAAGAVRPGAGCRRTDATCAVGAEARLGARFAQSAASSEPASAGRSTASRGRRLPADACPTWWRRGRAPGLARLRAGRLVEPAPPDRTRRTGASWPRASPPSRRAKLHGDAALASLQAIVRDDPRNGQMQLRLGDELLGRGRDGRCRTPLRGGDRRAASVGRSVPRPRQLPGAGRAASPTRSPRSNGVSTSKPTTPSSWPTSACSRRRPDARTRPRGPSRAPWPSTPTSTRRASTSRACWPARAVGRRRSPRPPTLLAATARLARRSGPKSSAWWRPCARSNPMDSRS